MYCVLLGPSKIYRQRQSSVLDMEWIAISRVFHRKNAFAGYVQECLGSSMVEMRCELYYAFKPCGLWVKDHLLLRKGRGLEIEVEGEGTR